MPVEDVLKTPLVLEHQQYVPAPDDLPVFPEAKVVKRKTPRQGGAGLRKRWKDKDYIYEWDGQHGKVEKYKASGKKHLGEFDPITGKQTKPADPTRSVEK